MATEHKPFIPSSQIIPELNFVTIITGIILGIIFGASSLYLALKVGLTVSASIPVAVLSVTLFRGISKVFKIRKTTILENNIVQTGGSAGESIAFGVAATMPALLIMGFEMSLGRTMLVAVLGSLLGILMMIPLRRVLIVKEHDTLIYPEGTACAEVLISGEKGGASAKMVFTGFFVGLIYKFLNIATKLWVDTPEKIFSSFKGANISSDVSPELLGVGYIIGPRIAAIMMAGGVLSSFVLTPLIVLFGDNLTTPLFPATKLISQMDIHEIWKNYILYIGAGAVAAGGIISLATNIPTIVRGAMGGLGSIKKSRGNKGDVAVVERIDRDIPNKYVWGGCLLLLIAIVLAKPLHMNAFGGILILCFGFLFVTVSSRLTGEIGSSSNPVSGMTVATLLFTCLIFLALGWVAPGDRMTALSVAAIVAIAAPVGGATSQDLKTGYLVGATPIHQQIAILFGALASAIVIGYVLQILNTASTVYTKQNLPTALVDVAGIADRETLSGPDAKHDSNSYLVYHVTEMQTAGPLAGLQPGKYLLNDNGSFAYRIDPGINGTSKTRDDGTPVQKYEAPKARLMSLIIDGILTQKLPWGLVLLGVFISIVLELSGISSLTFAVGVYLPISVSTPIFVGGFLRWIAEKIGGRKSASEAESSPGVLLSSGLIAGGAIGGIGIAMTALNENFLDRVDLSKVFSLANNQGFAVFIFALLSLFVVLVGSGKFLSSEKK